MPCARPHGFIIHTPPVLRNSSENGPYSCGNVNVFGKKSNSMPRSSLSNCLFALFKFFTNKSLSPKCQARRLKVFMLPCQFNMPWEMIHALSLQQLAEFKSSFLRQRINIRTKHIITPTQTSSNPPPINIPILIVGLDPSPRPHDFCRHRRRHADAETHALL